MSKNVTKIYKNSQEYQLTDENAQTSIDNIVDQLNKLEIPDKTSDLTNDSGFITSGYVDNKINYQIVSALTDVTNVKQGTLAFVKENFITTEVDNTNYPFLAKSYAPFYITPTGSYAKTYLFLYSDDFSVTCTINALDDGGYMSNNGDIWTEYAFEIDGITYYKLYNGTDYKLNYAPFTAYIKTPTQLYQYNGTEWEEREWGKSYLFRTINGSAITGDTSDLVIGGGVTTYSAGTHIDITDNTISATGLQETLVSGTNIKTINNQTLLGEGNITIEGGSGGGTSIVNLTQAEYDALETKDANTIYNITDAEEFTIPQFRTINSSAITGDTSDIVIDCYTKAETDALTGTCYSAATANTWTPNCINGTGYVGIQRSGTTTSTYNGIRISGSTSNFSITTGSTSANNSGIRYWQLNDISTGSTNLQSAITTKLANYTPTANFATINGNAITGGGNINISTQSTEMGVQEVTQEYYNSLTDEEKAANVLFIITDATLPTEWTGTQEEYDALGTYDSNCTYYII